MVYSPSSTVTWLECPLKWHLSHKWEQKVIGKPALSRIVGQALAQGIALYLTKTGDPLEVVPVVATQALEGMLARGHRLDEREEPFARNLGQVCEKGMGKFIAANPLPPAWEIVEVETPLLEYGPCIPDLLVRINGGLCVLDWKVKRTLDTRYLQATLDDYRDSWQFSHYRWAVEEVKGEPVVQSITGLVILDPFKVILDHSVPDPEIDQMWLTGAQRVWAQMELEESRQAHPWTAATHRTRYGRCDFWDACFTHRLHDELISMDYVRRERGTR